MVSFTYESVYEIAKVKSNVFMITNIINTKKVDLDRIRGVQWFMNWFQMSILVKNVKTILSSVDG